MDPSIEMDIARYEATRRGHEQRSRLLQFVRFVEKAHSGHSAEHGCTSGICAEIDKLQKDGLLKE
jgi:hypothetical protein